MKEKLVTLGALLIVGYILLSSVVAAFAGTAAYHAIMAPLTKAFGG